MKGVRVPSAGFCLLLLAAIGGAQQELTGTWVLSVELDVGSGGATFVFEQDGGKITGSYTGILGQGIAVTGTINGDQVEWSFDSQAGTITFKGKITGTEMEGTCSYGALGDGTFKGKKTDQGQAHGDRGEQAQGG